MSNVPVSKNALVEFNGLVNEAHQILKEARSGSRSDLPGKLAEAENRLNRIQALLCPMMIMS